MRRAWTGRPEKTSAAVDRANRARYRAAIKKQGFESVTLERIVWDEVDRTSASCRTSDPARCVIQRDGKTVIAIGPHAAGCRPAPDVDFIRRGNQVFRVEHDLLAGATRALAVCECERAHGCGVRDPTRSFGYVLPRGLRYAGTPP